MPLSMCCALVCVAAAVVFFFSIALSYWAWAKQLESVFESMRAFNINSKCFAVYNLFTNRKLTKQDTNWWRSVSNQNIYNYRKNIARIFWFVISNFHSLNRITHSFASEFITFDYFFIFINFCAVWWRVFHFFLLLDQLSSFLSKLCFK